MNQVADRIYYDDPAALEFTAEVTAIRELARVDGRQVWQIALDRTAFYPTSGGQPHDTGELIATARSGAQLHVPVSSVEEDDAGEVWHTSAKPLQEGTEVRGVISADRRNDHTVQHSGQHLLSAILLRDFGARTVSFHLGEEESTIDLEGSTLSPQDLVDAEQSAARAIARALPLTIRYVTPEQAEVMKSEGVLRKLPPRSGNIRIVEIPGLDVNACGGTHVLNTAQIGPLLLRGTEKVRGSLRLSFVCGQRALREASRDFLALQALAQTLTTAVDSLPAAIDRLRSDARSQTRTIAALLEDLATVQAAQLSASGGVVVHTLPAGRDAAYAKLLASHLVRDTPTPAAIVTATAPDRCDIVLSAKPGVLDCGTVLRTALQPFGGRGGGSGEMAQGAVPSTHAEAALAVLRDVLPK